MIMNAQTVHPQTEAYTLVVGLGATGLSVVRFLARQGERVVVADSRDIPPNFEHVEADYECYFGAFDEELFNDAGLIVLSPGIAADMPVVKAAIDAGIEVIGDIELFARHAKSQVVGITGSNGKSTVTKLFGEMAKEAGIDVAVGGNIGTPALELLTTPEPELYVLELSSFQLEMTRSLECAAAVVLNVSEDHLDRHYTLAHYAFIKAQIFHGNGVMVINRDDLVVADMADSERKLLSYGINDVTDENAYGIQTIDGARWLMRGERALICESALKISGLHNLSNALAALALGEAVAFPEEAMLTALKNFTGLPHRCEWVAKVDNVVWYNDSKGTNVGATVAALDGLPQQRVILIAGGQGKDADFGPLKEVIARRAGAVILIGEDAPLIEQAIAGAIDAAQIIYAENLQQAVTLAAANARAGDAVLLSPACASFDMFASYIDRGEQFVTAVEGLTK